jgi:hypothetical protein
MLYLPLPFWHKCTREIDRAPKMDSTNSKKKECMFLFASLVVCDWATKSKTKVADFVAFENSMAKDQKSRKNIRTFFARFLQKYGLIQEAKDLWMMPYRDETYRVEKPALLKSLIADADLSWHRGAETTALTPALAPVPVPTSSQRDTDKEQVLILFAVLTVWEYTVISPKPLFWMTFEFLDVENSMEEDLEKRVEIRELFIDLLGYAGLDGQAEDLKWSDFTNEKTKKPRLLEELLGNSGLLEKYSREGRRR